MNRARRQGEVSSGRLHECNASGVPCDEGGPERRSDVR